MDISAGQCVSSTKANRTDMINTMKHKEIYDTMCRCIAHLSGGAEMEVQPRSVSVALKPLGPAQ
jgi:hypothetical protein